MKVLKKDLMSNGTKIQIEDWSTDYVHCSFGCTLGTYPISKVTLKGEFEPNFNERFRCEFNFKNNDDAEKAYFELLNGLKELSDFYEFLYYPSYRNCI